MRSIVARTLALTALALTTVPVAASAATVRPLDAHGPLGDERLSNETTVTRWAHAAQRAVVRTAPRRGAGHIGRLRYFTEDGFPEVYLVLSSRSAAGRTWLHIRVPGRPNGRTGWVAQAALGQLNVVRTHLVVERGRGARLFRDGRVVWSAPVGTGAPGTPTPAGHFYVRERMRASGGVYGPWAFGTSAYSALSDWPGGGVVGIHGTDQPGLVPGRPSHGCIRVRNGDIRRLARLMPVGTPITIR